MTALLLTVDAFTAPKRGASPDDWEDAWAADTETGRLCVADGASSAPSAGRWAQDLCAAFVSKPFDPTELPERPARFEAWLAELQERWTPNVDASQWWAEAVTDSFATLLAVHIAPTGALSGTAVGDSCLFHASRGEICLVAPLTSAEQFTSMPPLVGTAVESRPAAVRGLSAIETCVKRGDSVYLATDAFSQWLLRARTHGDHHMIDLLESLDPDRFKTLLEGLRARDQIENDDVTLLRCRIGRPSRAST